jgi:RNA polymerase sigma factor (sigma-70 family)
MIRPEDRPGGAAEIRRRPLTRPPAGRTIDAMTPQPPDTAPGDEQLAEIIARRSASGASWRAAQDACAELYWRYARPLAAFLSARLDRSRLEDAHQDIWKRVWQHLPKSFRGGSFRAWLYQVARNYLIDLRRKPRLSALGDEQALPAAAPEAEQHWIQEEHRDLVRHCLEKLAAPAAELVKARLGGERYPDICRRLNLQPNQAHKLFHQAKAQLRSCVQRGVA